MKRVKLSTFIISVLLIMLTLGYDQWTKHVIAKHLELYESKEIIHNFFYITYVQNTGAGFSLFSDYGVLFFSIITIGAILLILYLYVISEDYRYQLPLALVFSGAVGNFIDRLIFGYVRDFFSVYIFNWSFPVFNIADICICIGVFILFVVYFYDDYKEKKRWKQESSL